MDCSVPDQEPSRLTRGITGEEGTQLQVAELPVTGGVVVARLKRRLTEISNSSASRALVGSSRTPTSFATSGEILAATIVRASRSDTSCKNKPRDRSLSASGACTSRDPSVVLLLDYVIALFVIVAYILLNAFGIDGMG